MYRIISSSKDTYITNKIIGNKFIIYIKQKNVGTLTNTPINNLKKNQFIGLSVIPPVERLRKQMPNIIVKSKKAFLKEVNFLYSTNLIFSNFFFIIYILISISYLIYMLKPLFQ